MFCWCCLFAFLCLLVIMFIFFGGGRVGGSFEGLGLRVEEVQELRK